VFAAQGAEMRMSASNRLALSCAAALSLVSAAVHADFASCVLSNNPLVTGADPLNYVRFALRADGRPVLAYTSDVHNNSSLYLYDCANPSCSAGHVVYIDTTSNYFGAPGIVIRADGRPAIVASYFGGVRLYDCDDAHCSSYGVHVIFANSSGILNDLPTVLQTNGNPLFLYVDSSIGARPGQLIVHHCDDAVCDAPGTEQVLALPPMNAGFAMLSLRPDADGKPVATYLTSVGASNLYDIDIATCSDAACSSVTTAQLSAPVLDSTPTRTALAVRSDKRPLALDNQRNNRTLLDCTSAACMTADDRPLPASAVGQPLGLQLLSGDLPAFALFNAGTVAAFACSDGVCSSGTVHSASSATQAVLDGDFAVGADARPALAYIDFDARALAVAGCSNADLVFIDGFD
jgi:hypothetical protein